MADAGAIGGVGAGLAAGAGLGAGAATSGFLSSFSATLNTGSGSVTASGQTTPAGTQLDVSNAATQNSQKAFADALATLLLLLNQRSDHKQNSSDPLALLAALALSGAAGSGGANFQASASISFPSTGPAGAAAVGGTLNVQA